MIRRVKEGLRRYKKTLMRHERMYRRLVKKYDQNFGKGHWSLSDCSDVERDEIVRVRICIMAMSIVLGLSRKEEIEIDGECGIKYPR